MTGHAGKMGGSAHHWAPVHLFGGDEADRWPTGWLCQPCHTEWHRLVTPRMHEARAS